MLFSLFSLFALFALFSLFLSFSLSFFSPLVVCFSFCFSSSSSGVGLGRGGAPQLGTCHITPVKDLSWNDFRSHLRQGLPERSRARRQALMAP